jgi:hypothetical protein
MRLVVVGKDAEAVNRFDASHCGGVELITHCNSAGASLAWIGNFYLDSFWDGEIFGLCHADCKFGPGALAAFEDETLSGRICGIVGRDCLGRYRWCSQAPGLVSTLDSCSVFFHRGHQLRFDARTFDSFHLHVEDLCLQAQARGIPVIVPEADATHLGPLPTPEWQAAYRPYRERLTQKWRGVRFQTT